MYMSSCTLVQSCALSVERSVVKLITHLSWITSESWSYHFHTAIHVPICSIAKYDKEEYEMIVAVDRALIKNQSYHFQHSHSCAYFHPRQLTSLAHSLLSLTLDMGTMLSPVVAHRWRWWICQHVSDKNAHKWFRARDVYLLFCADHEIRDTILAQSDSFSWSRWRIFTLPVLLDNNARESR